MFRMRAFVPAVLLLGVVAAHAQDACELPRPNEILGTVAGQPITRSQAEAVWREKDPASFFSFERQRYEMTMHAMREIAAEALVKQEAERRQTTVDDMLAAEIAARSKPLSESDARVAFINELMARSSSLMEVRDRGPRQAVPIDADDPSMGPEDAPLTLVLFSDFQCPYCRQAEPVLAALQKTFSGQVRFVWKDFPLPSHADAKPAAVAARCAGEQGAFWRYRDQLFQNQEDLGEEGLRRIARALGLDEAAFATCAASNRFGSVIDAKINEGRLLGVNSTPTLFINGAAVAGAVPLERLESMIRDELKLLGR